MDPSMAMMGMMPPAGGMPMMGAPMPGGPMTSAMQQFNNLYKT